MLIESRNNRAIYKLEDFRVGDWVRHRTWTVPGGNLPQEPQVSKKVRRISSIENGSIWCGRTEFKAFELVFARS